MARLSLRFFGSFQASLAGKPLISFRSSKVQGLLIYLALTHQRSHARDTLAALFWPEVPDTVAKKNLRQSLYQLRQVLGDVTPRGEPFLLVTRSTVQFNSTSDHALDVSTFLSHVDHDQLEQAAAAFQGDLLPEFSCDSLPFEEWLLIERQRLHRLALDALFKLAAQSLAAADYDKARDLAQRQLALEPWHEEAHRQLMQTLALLGERSAALAQYETCRRALAEELRVQPAAETEALMARIRDQQLGRDERRPPIRPLEHRQLTMPFVGRKREHGTLVSAYQRACHDGMQVVMLFGKAGVGKTRLTQTFLDWAAAQGADILRGSAFETSGGLPYQPLTQALRQRLERENAPEDLLSDLWLTQLCRLLPELRDRYPDLPEPTQEESTARQHLFEAITRLGRALAQRAPLVILLDDWHWADPASLDVLHYAALRWAESRTPILVLLTLRQESLGESPELHAWLTRLKREIAYTQLELTSLSELETEQLIRVLLVEPEEGANYAPPAGAEKLSPLTRFSRWLFEETDGQPLFLVETLKALVAEGLVRPDAGSNGWRVDWQTFDQQASDSGARVLPGVQEIVRGWLNRISASANRLLTAAAILGQGTSFDDLCRVAELEDTQALTALDELLARQLLLETDAVPGRNAAYRFSHQKVAEVVYAEAGAARRRLLHRRAFEALQAAPAPAAELAHHALNASLWPEAVRYSIVAGNEALSLLAVPVATAHYETAWQTTERTGWPEAISGADRLNLYAGLGRAYELAEAWPRAQQMYQAMITYARTIEAASIECQGLNHLATVYTNGFKEPQQAIPLLEQARAVAEQSGDLQGLVDTEWNLSLAAVHEQKPQLGRDHGEQALEKARQLGHPQLLARCLNSLSYIYAQLRQWDMAEAHATEARDLYAAAGNRVLEADSQRMLGMSQMFSGRTRESLVTLRDAFAFSRQIDNLWGEADCAWRLAHTLLELGRYGQAASLARQAVEQAPMVGVPTMVLLAQLTWGTVQRTVMALAAAQQTLLDILTKYIEPGLAGFADWTLAELCALHAINGEWGQAHDYALRTLRSRRDESLLPMGLTGWYETEALLRGGSDDLARAEVARLAEITGNNRRHRLPLLRSQAVLAQWDGDIDLAVTYLRDARALAQEIGLPGEEWPILGTLAALYAGQGDPAGAQRAWSDSADTILSLSETIDEEDLRAGFLASEPIQAILDKADRAEER